MRESIIDTVDTIEEYFNKIYGETYPLLLRYISQRLDGLGAYHDICDAIQETYCEFFKIINKKGVDYAKNPLAVLYKIAGVRLKRKYAQKKKQSKILPLHVNSDPDDEEIFITDFENMTGVTEEDKIIDKILAENIMSVINNGDPDSARIFILRYEYDMKLEDIAKELGMEFHTVRNKLYRKIAEMKKLFDN
jgi:RNA polymerase sigma factor (sigma-70 family)